jgi:hypothetical protein
MVLRAIPNSLYKFDGISWIIYDQSNGGFSYVVKSGNLFREDGSGWKGFYAENHLCEVK